jgi:hypothetical protein
MLGKLGGVSGINAGGLVFTNRRYMVASSGGSGLRLKRVLPDLGLNSGTGKPCVFIGGLGRKDDWHDTGYVVRTSAYHRSPRWKGCRGRRIYRPLRLFCNDRGGRSEVEVKVGGS